MENKEITKKDIRKAYLRWYNTVEVSNSYERMQTVAFCYSISGILKKLYDKKEDYVKALQRHLNFFNTQGIWGSSLLGSHAASRRQAEAEAQKQKEILRRLVRCPIWIKLNCGRG